MAKKYKDQTTIAVAVVVLLLLIGAIWYWSGKQSQSPTNTTTPPSQLTTAPPTSPTSTPSTTKKPTGSTAYQKALSTYQYRIQFSQCRGENMFDTHGSLVVAKGSKVMLDNRDPVAHTIAFKGFSQRIVAYGWYITTVYNAGTFDITCDGGGSAQLTVE